MFGCVSMSVIFLIVVVAVVRVMRLLGWKVVAVVWWLCCGLCFRKSSAAEIFWGFCWLPMPVFLLLWVTVIEVVAFW